MQAGQPPVVNGVAEERMRVGCGSATIGMFARQWHGHVDEVVVVDDQALVREGLAMVLDHEPDIDVVGEGGDRGQPQEPVEGARVQRMPTQASGHALRDRVKWLEQSVSAAEGALHGVVQGQSRGAAVGPLCHRPPAAGQGH